MVAVVVKGLRIDRTEAADLHGRVENVLCVRV